MPPSGTVYCLKPLRRAPAHASRTRCASSRRDPSDTRGWCRYARARAEARRKRVRARRARRSSSAASGCAGETPWARCSSRLYGRNQDRLRFPRGDAMIDLYAAPTSNSMRPDGAGGMRPRLQVSPDRDREGRAQDPQFLAMNPNPGPGDRGPRGARRQADHAVAVERDPRLLRGKSGKLMPKDGAARPRCGRR